MSYFAQEIIRDIFGLTANVTPKGELWVANPERIIGGIFPLNAANTYFSNNVVTGSGSVTVSGGQAIIRTGTTANSTALNNTFAVARYIGGTANLYRGIIRLNNTGSTNNVRTWGIGNTTDGAYFKLSGTTMYVCTMYNGTETAIVSSSWNKNTTVPTLTNGNTYEIIYTNLHLYFIINDVLVHKADYLTGPWTQNMNMPIYITNINSGGATTDNIIYVQAVTVYALGKSKSNTIIVNITAAGTYNLKLSTGAIHDIVINNPGGTTDTLTIYDNTSATGKTIGTIAAGKYGAPNGLNFNNGAQFNIGLTVVAVGTTDYTIIYE